MLLVKDRKCLNESKKRGFYHMALQVACSSSCGIASMVKVMVNPTKNDTSRSHLICPTQWGEIFFKEYSTGCFILKCARVNDFEGRKDQCFVDFPLRAYQSHFLKIFSVLSFSLWRPAFHYRGFGVFFSKKNAPSERISPHCVQPLRLRLQNNGLKTFHNSIFYKSCLCIPTLFL